MSGDVPIIQKVYDFYREFYQAIPQMPKQDRHAIGERIQNICLDLLERLIYASRRPKINTHKAISISFGKIAGNRQNARRLD